METFGKLLAPAARILPVVALMAMAATASQAGIPGPNGVFTGCILPSQQIRIIDTAVTPNCNSNEIMVTWNQTGPAGPQGAAGPQGPAGAQGPAGPSHVYYAANDNFRSLGTLDSPTVAASVTVPAGTYLLDGRANVTNDALGVGATIVCYPSPVIGPLAIYGYSFLTVLGIPNADAKANAATITVTHAVTLASTTNVQLLCYSLPLDGASGHQHMLNGSMRATLVGGMN